ncbi:T-cell receptor gamma alternate reading frame protein [Urocitellus parryii]
MKTNNTYMKMSWLTVTGESMDKEHRCIVKHENNKRGVDQEILFPAIRKVVTTMNPREADLKVTTAVTTINARKSDLKCENVVNTTESEAYSKDALRLQLTNTSVYWTYLLLLLKSVVYLAFVTFSLLRKTAVVYFLGVESNTRPVYTKLLAEIHKDEGSGNMLQELRDTEPRSSTV